MANVLYFPDGGYEVILGDQVEAFKKIIYERLGLDCEELFTEIISEHKGKDVEDYEMIIDDYRGVVEDAINGLHEVLMQPRLDRKRLEAIYDDLIISL